MPKDKYPLKAVLEVRAEQKDQAVGLVAACRVRLELAEAELSTRVRAVEDCRREQATAEGRMLEQAARACKAQVLIAHRDFIVGLKETERELSARVEEQQVIVERAAGELERATATLVEAAREEQVVEKHRENWRRARLREAGRAEQKQLDEVGSILFARRSLD